MPGWIDPSTRRIEGEFASVAINMCEAKGEVQGKKLMDDESRPYRAEGQQCEEQ